MLKAKKVIEQLNKVKKEFEESKGLSGKVSESHIAPKFKNGSKENNPSQKNVQHFKNPMQSEKQRKIFGLISQNAQDLAQGNTNIDIINDTKFQDAQKFLKGQFRSEQLSLYKKVQILHTIFADTDYEETKQVFEQVEELKTSQTPDEDSDSQN